MFDFSDATLLAGGEPPFRHAFGDKFERFFSWDTQTCLPLRDVMRRGLPARLRFRDRARVA
jgi:hypothetical protein